MKDLRYIGHLASWCKRPRDARACRATSLLDMDHLSLGDVDRWISEKSHRQKLSRSGVKPSPSDNEYWASLNRVPRRPPIYENDRRSFPPGDAA